MKNITSRHRLILQRLRENGQVDILELSDLMKVSGVTIKKDLKALKDLQNRPDSLHHHGNAVPAETVKIPEEESIKVIVADK